MVTQVLGFVCSVATSVWEALNSGFGLAFVGGLTGAFGGALGAQRIVERGKAREEAIRELRDTNAACTVAFMCCNAGLRSKNQHIRPIYEQLTADKQKLSAAKAAQAAGAQAIQVQLLADLKVFPAPVLPIDVLRNLAFNRISSPARVLALVADMEQALVGLQLSIAKRDALIDEFRSVPKNLLHCHYLGAVLPDGSTNQEYPDVVEVIHSYVDDLIWFSATLCGELVSYGNERRKRMRKRDRRAAPSMAAPDFSGPRKDGLFPSDDQYSSWTNAFKTKQVQSEQRSWGSLFPHNWGAVTRWLRKKPRTP